MSRLVRIVNDKSRHFCIKIYFNAVKLVYHYSSAADRRCLNRNFSSAFTLKIQNCRIGVCVLKLNCRKEKFYPRAFCNFHTVGNAYVIGLHTKKACNKCAVSSVTVISCRKRPVELNVCKDNFIFQKYTRNETYSYSPCCM